ncbi:hypothetical protein [Streptomyces sp. NPDC018045]|uniref:hypothetical protein n=1 Tax=Streptomyces sp. NPDC018045 TaxID=3365037 RepID=UPI00379955B1
MGDYADAVESELTARGLLAESFSGWTDHGPDPDPDRAEPYAAWAFARDPRDLRLNSPGRAAVLAPAWTSALVVVAFDARDRWQWHGRGPAWRPRNWGRRWVGDWRPLLDAPLPGPAAVVDAVECLLAHRLGALPYRVRACF